MNSPKLSRSRTHRKKVPYLKPLNPKPFKPVEHSPSQGMFRCVEILTVFPWERRWLVDDLHVEKQHDHFDQAVRLFFLTEFTRLSPMEFSDRYKLIHKSFFLPNDRMLILLYLQDLDSKQSSENNLPYVTKTDRGASDGFNVVVEKTLGIKNVRGPAMLCEVKIIDTHFKLQNISAGTLKELVESVQRGLNEDE